MFRSLSFQRMSETFAVLRVRNFRNLWTGQMISFVGDALAYNTLTLAIIRMANAEGASSGKLLSALFILSALPPLFLGMVAGTIVDRANRKHVMIAADLIRGVLALGFLWVHELDQVWMYFVVSVLLSAVSAFFFPARTAILPTLLDKEQLLSANALAQLTHTLAFVVGAAAAGLLVGKADATAPAFIVDSLSFFVSAFFIARIDLPARASAVASAFTAAQEKTSAAATHATRRLGTMLDELLVGMRYVLTDQLMRGILISFLALFLGLGAANVTFVPLLVNDLNMPEENLGIIRLSQTLGIILGSAMITAVAARYRPRDLIGITMMAFGVTTLIVSVVSDFYLMVTVLFAVGLVISPPQIIAATLMQRHVPEEKLGRASGAQGTIINVANIASMGAAGYLMDEIGARNVFTLAGILIISAGIVSWWVLRDAIPADADIVPHDPIPTPQSATLPTE